MARWMTGELSDEEKAQLSEEELSELRVVVDEVARWSLPDVQKKSFFDDLPEQTADVAPKQVNFRPWLAIAASVSLLLLAVWYWSSTGGGEQLYVTGIGEQLRIELPDGSIVNLDAASELAYQVDDFEVNRTVQIKGQAYFEVVSGSEFLVKADLGQVTVLGTKFNVFNFNDRFVVSCFEGSVGVIYKSSELLLQAGEESVLSDGNLIKDSLETDQPAWKAGSLSYSGVPLQEICDDMSRYYEVSISLPPKYRSSKYTGKLPLDDLEDALKRLFLPMQIEYVLSEDGKVIIE